MTGIIGKEWGTRWGRGQIIYTTEARRVLLSNQLEVRQRDLRVVELITLKPHLPRRQSSVSDAGIEVGGG